LTHWGWWGVESKKLSWIIKGHETRELQGSLDLQLFHFLGFMTIPKYRKSPAQETKAVCFLAAGK